MEITQAGKDDVVILQLEGRLDVGSAATLV